MRAFLAATIVCLSLGAIAAPARTAHHVRHHHTRQHLHRVARARHRAFAEAKLRLRAGRAQAGFASVYGRGSGPRTANCKRRPATGERLNEYANPPTAAHRSFPFDALVRGRIIDLTPAAARVLDFSGLAPVDVKRIR